jgi:dTDP-4-amino-4,6-dideoxygalactose transaminase
MLQKDRLDPSSQIGGNTLMSETALSVKKAINVPLLDLKAQFEGIHDEIEIAIKRVLRSQRFVLGPEVGRLEERIAEYCQAKHGIGVSSGTDALLVALMALEIGPGDEVITTPYSFFATAGAIARVGARPIFCDIDPFTYNLDADAVADFIRYECEQKHEHLFHRRTGGAIKALLPAHLFGQVADMDHLMAIARKNRLHIIEDAAQAIGAESAGNQRAGSLGDIACFSFFPSKNLGAFGDGGMCTTSDERLAERMRILRVHGGNPKYHHTLIGGNFRLDALQAAVLAVKFDYLDGWTAARQDNAVFYDRKFSGSAFASYIETPVCLPGFRHIYNQYVVRTKSRDMLREFLTERNIGTEIYYPVPLHRQECFDYLGNSLDICPQSIKAAAETLAIPIFPELTSIQQQYVVDSIAVFYK